MLKEREEEEEEEEKRKRRDGDVASASKTRNIFYHNTDRNITVAKKEYNVFSVIFTKGYVIGLNLSLSFFFFGHFE